MATIVLDAGHGGRDPGAVGTLAGAPQRRESDDNLRLTLAVGNILRNRGCNIIYTRETDVFVPLGERARIANNRNADLFVSIHRNASVNANANGIENWIHTNADARTTQIANTVLNYLAREPHQSNRGIQRGNFQVLRETRMPAMLLEVGFISNARDNQLFDQNFNAYATAIANGIASAIGGCRPGVTPPPVAPPASSFRRVCTQGGNLNVRATPNGNIIFQIPNNTQVRLLSYQTGWAQIEVDGRTGWVSANFLCPAGGVSPPAPPPISPPAFNPPYPGFLIRRGMSGDDVRTIQRMLNRIRTRFPQISPAPLAVDGVFGPLTENAVMNFQRLAGIGVDGIVGPISWARMVEFYNR